MSNLTIEDASELEVNDLTYGYLNIPGDTFTGVLMSALLGLFKESFGDPEGKYRYGTFVDIKAAASSLSASISSDLEDVVAGTTTMLEAQNNAEASLLSLVDGSTLTFKSEESKRHTVRSLRAYVESSYSGYLLS